MSTFNIGSVSGQGFAIGDHATVISEAGHVTIGACDPRLLKELSRLHDELSRISTTPEQRSAVAAVDSAIAHADDARRMADFLKHAGRWALDVATAIGAELAAAAIRSAAGMR